MRIQTFKNQRGLIHGSDPKRIGCDIGGTLKVGATEIIISPGIESVMPPLANGSTGVYNATFTSILGNVYELEKVSVKAGRIVPPTQASVELMELRCRADALEAECESLREEIRKLSTIFDTDALNFLIK